MNDKIKITVITWDTYEVMIKTAAKLCNVDIDFYSRHYFEKDQATLSKAIASMRDSDIIVLNQTRQPYWDDILDEAQKLKNNKKLISMGTDPVDWGLTSVDPKIAIECYKYLTNNGEENCCRMIDYLKKTVMDMDVEVLPPCTMPWQGIIHYKEPEHIFETTEEYLEWYKSDPSKPWVAVLASRSCWIIDGCRIESQVAKDLEESGANVILIISMSIHDDERGSINIGEAIDRYLVRDGKPIVNAIVKTMGFMINRVRKSEEGIKRFDKSVDLLTSLNVPVFQPIIASNMTAEKWKTVSGLSTDISWSVALPEFEGLIEPMILGCARASDDGEYERVVFLDRSKHLAERVMARIALGKKPVKDRKIVFFLNNHPCSGLEANVGAASHLDTHQSMVKILNAMKDAGYYVTGIPKDSKEFIDTILERKALSEFRWTTVQEMKKCGGVVHMMSVQEYNEFFRTLSKEIQDDVIKTWGEPPGTGMVLDDEIMITGVSYGNVMVAVQPKRGCFGARCDGGVCKILHDPLCPPTHQYLASYHYYEEIWGSDAVIHVGTHGNLEFLPGKSVGMTKDCYPDIGIGKTPHIYIYNSDNPPEGTIAKRRSYATLIDHMQSVMTASELYDDFSRLEETLAQYDSARSDPSQSHQLHHMILEAANAANLKELGLNKDMPLDECVRLCHEALSKVRNSQMNLGMHVFGELPEGDRRTEFINSIMRYDSGHGSIRDLIANIMDLDLNDLYASQGDINDKFNISNGALIEDIGNKTRDFIGCILNGKDADGAFSDIGLSPNKLQSDEMVKYIDTIEEVDNRVDRSLEIESFLNALDGHYTPPGPSGVITRGGADILPTGRNFYSLDPFSVPTRAAWRVGIMLANSLLKKYSEETDTIPENVAFFWMSGDIMSAGGEMMAQIMYLLGVRPIYDSAGHVKKFDIIPLSELNRPRIDVTVRTSGILRDMFINCIDLIDSAVNAVSGLDEPPHMNYVRKHTLDSIKNGTAPVDATARLFSAPPGSYVSGVNLAVYASSWKTEEDLAKIYIATNGYAYGNGRNGEAKHEQFAEDLATVSITYNKIHSDEHDLLGCCCYFSNQGGLTAASKYLSGKDVKSYFGDTREPKDVNVHTLADELRRTVRTKLLNPAWIEGMKEHGYKGASDIMKRVGRVYGWEASTQVVDDWVFDDIASKFVNDDEMREFFKENNPYALEEITRRLLEAEQRELWNADEQTLNALRNNYVEIESWLEDLAGEGEFQGGSVDIITSDEVENWNNNIAPIINSIHKHNPNN